jgi:hypothetical protein
MKRATYEDVLNAPEDKIAEILEGELYLSPRPGPKHAAGASALGGLLGDPLTAGEADPEAGGFSMSRSFTSVSTSWFRTWPRGAGTVWPRCQPKRSSL